MLLQGDEFNACVALDEAGDPRPTHREGRTINYLVVKNLCAEDPSLDDEIFGGNFIFRIKIQIDQPLGSRQMLCPISRKGGRSCVRPSR